VGKVDHPVIDVGPAIVDADENRAIVGEVGDVGIARQRQGRMGGSQGGSVEDFAVGRRPPVKIVAIPGGDTRPVVVGLFARHVPAARNLVGAAEFERATALADGTARSRNHARARRHAVFAFAENRPVDGGAGSIARKRARRPVGRLGTGGCQSRQTGR